MLSFLFETSIGNTMNRSLRRTLVQHECYGTIYRTVGIAFLFLFPDLQRYK